MNCHKNFEQPRALISDSNLFAFCDLNRKTAHEIQSLNPIHIKSM